MDTQFDEGRLVLGLACSTHQIQPPEHFALLFAQRLRLECVGDRLHQFVQIERTPLADDRMPQRTRTGMTGERGKARG